MISDTLPGTPFEMGTNVTITIIFDGKEEAEDIYNKLLTNDGAEAMPMQEAFWIPAYDKVIAQFGVTWHVSGGE
ncbi:VOC family protein [Virgibacillus salexigens]|uniref:hypothetical protein n=1 Tax=Virgibacillus massiliensis TaxID=1462526 RepID=UPI001371ABBB|nr:hypothetical protein [Virgibacillus massiliensis]MYL41077.1 hypothetical protein [Virgibacillus massiliensis]